MKTPLAKGPFEDVPLAELFPGAASQELDRITAVAARVDAARPDKSLWWWTVGHATRPTADHDSYFGEDMYYGILLTCVDVSSDGSDWLELDLEIEWQPNGRQRAWAVVNVACWCDTDHNTHYPFEVAEEITEDVGPGTALERVAGPFLEWLNGPTDPSVWRERAGLPQPSNWG